MKTFVVSLNSAKEKQKHIFKISNESKVELTIFEAIDGKLLSQEDLNEKYNSKMAMQKNLRPLGLGEIGCAISHLEIAKMFLESEDDYICILEDDVVFDEKLKLIDVFSKSFPKHTDLVFLGHYAASYRPVCSSIWNRIKLNLTHKLTMPCERILGTHGYVLSRSGAKKMLDSCEDGIFLPIDHITGDIDLMNTYLMEPQLVELDPILVTQSLIEEERNQIHFKYSKMPSKWKAKVKKMIGWKALKKIQNKLLKFKYIKH